MTQNDFSLFDPIPSAQEVAVALEELPESELAEIVQPVSSTDEPEHALETDFDLPEPGTAAAAGVGKLNQDRDVLLSAIAEARGMLEPVLARVLGTRSFGDGARELNALRDALCDDFSHQESIWLLGVDRLCAYAESAFAPPSGVPLSISREGLVHDLGYRRQDLWQRHRDGKTISFPSFEDVWSRLQEQHGSQDAQNALDNQAVDAFIRAFVRGYHGMEEPKWRKGRLVLERQIWTEKRLDGLGMEMTFGCRESLGREMQVLANVMRVVGAHRLAEAFASLNGWGEWARNIVSRQRTPLPQDSGYITYLSKIEIEIGGEVANTLMAKVSERLAETQ